MRGVEGMSVFQHKRACRDLVDTLQAEHGDGWWRHIPASWWFPQC